jgi:hypothetical protein
VLNRETASRRPPFLPEPEQRPVLSVSIRQPPMVFAHFRVSFPISRIKESRPRSGSSQSRQIRDTQPSYPGDNIIDSLQLSNLRPTCLQLWALRVPGRNTGEGLIAHFHIYRLPRLLVPTASEEDEPSTLDGVACDEVLFRVFGDVFIHRPGMTPDPGLLHADLSALRDGTGVRARISVTGEPR